MKGNIPLHKGKKGICLNIGRTHFKKGEHPNKLTEFKKGEHPSKKTEFKKGHKLSLESETKRKKSLKKSSLKGENHPQWRGGISFEGHGIDFNNKFKRAIRKRDNQVCMLCKTHQEKLSRTLGIHHINYDKNVSIPQNCISLCPKCHGLTNHNRESWIKFFQELLAKEYKYKYSENKIIMEIKNE